MLAAIWFQREFLVADVSQPTEDRRLLDETGSTASEYFVLLALK